MQPSEPKLLDLSGVPCPLNFVRTKLALEELPPGTELRVRVDAGEPARNLPESLKKSGFAVPVVTVEADGRVLVLVKKS